MCHIQKESMEAIVSVVVKELGNVIKMEADLMIGIENEVRKLCSKFKAIRAILGKAEKKQFTDETVRDWLGKIKEVVYEVEDILDEWRTDAFLSQRDKDDIGNQRKVRSHSFIPCLCFKQVKLRNETGHRIRKIAERLDEISKEKIDFSLNEDNKIEEVELMPDMKVRETGSLIDESKIFGRDHEKDSIINELVSDNNRDQKSVSITSIVGMGGLGKTTLAQLVCKDKRVMTHFKKIIWVCASDPFDVYKIANKVIKSMGGYNRENPDLDTMQHSLAEAVSKIPFLLVLDDVWNENETLWEQLKVPLMGAAQGSKILVTTRNHKAAEVMETTHFHDLEHLSHTNCWKLFKSIALKGVENEEFLELTKVDEEIVRRCKGLPLAVGAVGSLLARRRTYGYWKHILECKIWEWDVGILPSLLLSYYSLPLHLKLCFSFCSLFPKDFEMSKDELVKLWMARGLIESEKADIEVDIEEIGGMYFDDLLARSLFQDAMKKDGNIYGCKMHDLVHDLATRVTDGDYCCTETAHSPINCHHLSLLLNRDLSSVPSLLCEATRLRTLLFVLPDSTLRWGGRSKIKAIPDSLFSHMRFLRALDLSKTSLEDLPSSISKLKHLRYLNLIDSMIKGLPESVTDLCNLQTLKLSGCIRLCMLPSGMGKMVKLRHLEIEVTRNLTFLPNGLGNLIRLRTLSKFPLWYENRGCKIGEVKNLNLLRGKLRIENLEKVLNVNEAREAQLNQKSYLQTLHFYYKHKTDEEWRKLGDDEMERMEGVFEGLGPLHSNLKELVIEGYAGSKFSSWLEDSAFSNLTDVRLGDCRRLRLLPSLGNLCPLKSLEIYRADEVKVVGGEFYGIGDDKGRAFPKLDRLSFCAMGDWEEWKLTDEYGEVMPSLKELEITNCNKLKALPDRLPSNLRKVIVACEEITWMPCNVLPLLERLSLTGHVKVILSPFPALKTLKIVKASNESLSSDGWELLESLHTIEIVDCPRLAFLPDEMGKLKALQILRIESCHQLTYLPEGLGQLEMLHTVSITGCNGFTSFTSLFNGSGQFNALRHLSIDACNGLRSLSDGLVLFDALQSLFVSDCSKLQSLFDGFEQLKSLLSLSVIECPELRHFPPLQHLTALEELNIIWCPLARKRLEKEIVEDRCNLSHIRIYVE